MSTEGEVLVGREAGLGCCRHPSPARFGGFEDHGSRATGKKRQNSRTLATIVFLF